jgi:hypothetical protein
VIRRQTWIQRRERKNGDANKRSSDWARLNLSVSDAAKTILAALSSTMSRAGATAMPRSSSAATGKLSDAQKDHPKPAANPPTSQECIGHFLLGLADFFAELSERLREFGRSLIALAGREAERARTGRHG